MPHERGISTNSILALPPGWRVTAERSDAYLSAAKARFWRLAAKRRSIKRFKPHCSATLPGSPSTRTAEESVRAVRRRRGRA